MTVRSPAVRPSRNLFRRVLCQAALIAGGALAGVAHAITGSVTVYWDTLRIEVIDADPLDGITPQLTWRSQTTASGTFRDGVGPLPDGRYVSDWVTAEGADYGDATLSVKTRFDAATLRVDAASTGGAWSASRIERYGEFEVDGAAEIRATVAMEAHVSATADELLWRDAFFRGVWPYADANLFFGDGFRNAMSTVSYLRADLDTWGVDYAGEMTTSVTLGAGGSAYLFTQPGVVLNPVPEPSTWMTMAAGLALLGAGARRSGPRARRLDRGA